MEKIKNAGAFIETFMPLYFKPCEKYQCIESRKNTISHYGLDGLNETDYDAEQEIMNLYYSGIYDEKALAWKAGKVFWNNDHLCVSDDFIKKDALNNIVGYFIGQRKKDVDKNNFNKYRESLNEHRGDILSSLIDEDYESAYRQALSFQKNVDEDKGIKNFGPVNIINALFFLSSGKAPIYDAYAHKAARALAMDWLPSKVFVGINPNKTEITAVCKMYREYIDLLNELFPDYIKKHENKAYIPRDLDRALWVYGHSINNKWSNND